MSDYFLVEIRGKRGGLVKKMRNINKTQMIEIVRNNASEYGEIRIHNTRIK